MTENNGSKKHPLDGVDEWECYDQLIAERNRLISAKRESEDGFIKTIIQLSSAILLLVPSLVTANSSRFEFGSYSTLIIGLGTIAMALLLSLSEQFSSSLAYQQQIKKTDEYYTKKSTDIDEPSITKIVRALLLLSFISFLIGIFLIAYWFTSSIG